LALIILLNDTINFNTSNENSRQSFIQRDLYLKVSENVINQLAFQINLLKPILQIDFEQVSILNINKTYIEEHTGWINKCHIKYGTESKTLK
jgi:hypothetical protein